MHAQSNKKRFEDKIDAFFDKNYALICAPIIVLVLYMVALAIYGVYPFGNKYTAASYDLSAQICPFIEHIFDVIDGKSTLTYSYAIIGGADVTGSFLYFFISPFSFLFLIFGDGKVAYASSIVMMCKLAAVAFAGTWFAKKLFKDIPDYICVAVGVVYTYCGYMFVSNTYINWVDFLIYMPFAAGAFKHYVETGKFLPFSIVVACCIYTCFSIACFSLFTVFPALIGYGVICVEKERRNKFIAYLCLAFLVAILIALPVLVPALMAFMGGARGGSLFESFWYGYEKNTDGTYGAFINSEFIEAITNKLYAKSSYILSDSIFVILTLVWFTRSRLQTPFSRFMLLAGVMTLLPVFVDEAMLLMNMGSYMSYALRFGFLNALFFLGGACLALEGISFKKDCAFDGSRLLKPLKEIPIHPLHSDEPVIIVGDFTDEGGMYELNPEVRKKKRRVLWICKWGMLALGAVAALVFAFMNLQGGIKAIWAIFTDNETILNSIGSFAGRFAHSLGGMEVVILFFTVLAVVAGLGILLVALKKLSPRVLSLILVAVVGFQVVFYNNMLVAGNRSTQHVAVGHYQTLSAELNSRDDTYFRVKDYGKMVSDGDGNQYRTDCWTSCIPFSGNSNAFSVFSSVIAAENFATFELFGYQSNKKNNYKSTHNSGRTNKCEAFGDSFLGYKYFFVPKSQIETVEALSYVKPEMVENEQGESVHLQSGDYYVYRNEIVFPLGYRVQSGEFRYTHEDISANRLQNQAALYNYLSGNEVDRVTTELAVKLSKDLHKRAADVEVSAGQIKATVTAKKGENLLLNFVASKAYKVTVNGKEAKLVDNDLKFLVVELEEGYNEVVFTYSSPYVKYMAVGTGFSLLSLCLVALVLKKTRLMDKLSGVVSWLGILLAVAVVGFFMILPCSAFALKLFTLLR